VCSEMLNTEWPSGATDAKFYVPHNSVRGIENSVIDFDIDNMYHVLYDSHKVEAEKVTERVNKHYMTTRTLGKRAFGAKAKDDFQQYNWGLSLTLEMGLMSDQAELMMLMYTRVVDGRITEKEYDLIIISHTSFKRIRKNSKRSKWRDLRTSWKIHAKKIKGVPLSISKKHFLKILDVNDLTFDINMERLSRDMMGFDYESEYMHSLLVDDPLLRGSVPPPKKTISYFPFGKKAQPSNQDNITDDEYIQAFRQQMESEARNFARERAQEVALKADFDKQAIIEERKLLRRMQSEEARREAAYIATDDLSLKVREIKMQRQSSKEEEQKVMKKQNTAELLQATRNAPAIERSNSKIHIPQAARSASKPKPSVQSKSTERQPLTRSVTSVERPSPEKTASEEEENKAKKKRDISRLPRSSSVDTHGQSHFARMPSYGEGDVVLAPLYDIDDLSSQEGDEDEFAAALLAEERASEEQTKRELEIAKAKELAKEKERAMAKAKEREKKEAELKKRREEAQVYPEESSFKEAQIYPEEAQVYPDDSHIGHDEDSLGGGDDFHYEEDSDDEQYYMDEMSEVVVDQLARDLEDDLISVLSSMVLSADSSKDAAKEANKDDGDVDLLLEVVLDIVTDDIATSLCADAVSGEALYLAEFEEFDSIASDFSKFQELSQHSLHERESTRLELDRLERFHDGKSNTPASYMPEPSPVMYAISDDIQQPTYFPDLSDLFNLPHQDFVFNVPKTGNLLRVLIRHDDEGDRNGLFIHGFKSYSRAEEQGLLRVGDEILAINDIHVQGQQLEAVVDALVDHEDEFVRMVVRRREGFWNDGSSPRSNISWNDQSISTQSSPRAFVISDQVQQPDVFPDFGDLLALPSQDLLFRVPKTNGTLRVQIRHDDDGDMKGLFIHGFRPFSKAEAQGFLKVGDELIEINGVDVQGEQLEVVIDVLQHSPEDDEFVDMVVRRRDQLEEILKYAPYFSPRAAGGFSPRGENIGRDGIEAIHDMQWDDIAIDNDSSDSGIQIGEGAFSITSSIGSGISGGIAVADQGYESEVVYPNEHDSDSDSPRLEEVVDEFDVSVPRTDGALRVMIRSIDSLPNSGFYVHGFKPMCKAEGFLRTGDIILEIDGKNVSGLLLKDVATILDGIKGNTVLMKIRRSYVVKNNHN
jgi:hypothetical protein